MVVFTCHHCGESLSKPKVEKHFTFVCRTIKSLTCVDCFKDFRGEEYVSHTKCLTEEERYAAKGTYTNKLVKKGEAKQEVWTEMVKSILNDGTNMNSSRRAIFDLISNASNIPRKKSKFLNFIQSSSGGRAYMKDIEEVWNLIEQYKGDYLKDKKQTNGIKPVNEAEQIEMTNISPSKTKKSNNENNETKKRKITTEGSKENEQNENVPKTKKQRKTEEATLEKKEEQLEVGNKGFRFQDVILEILSKKESISLKKLQKKVINAYLKDTGETEITPKIIKKFNKKLKKLLNVEVNDGVVILKTTNE